MVSKSLRKLFAQHCGYITDVGEVSNFSLFHGKKKNKKLDLARVTAHFRKQVANSYRENMTTEKSLLGYDKVLNPFIEENKLRLV